MSGISIVEDTSLQKAEYASVALDMLQYAKEEGLGAEVLMTYTNLVREDTAIFWNATQLMERALLEWDL